MYFAYITARVHQMIMQQWHAATTTRHSYTLTYQFLTDLQTFDWPRVASRYSVWPKGSAMVRLGVRDFEIHWISRGFRISVRVDFWISVWISADRFLLVCSWIF